MRSTAAVASVNPVTPSVDTVGVGVADPVRADPFNDAPVTAPMLWPLCHVVVRWCVDRARLDKAGGLTVGHDWFSPGQDVGFKGSHRPTVLNRPLRPCAARQRSHTAAIPPPLASAAAKP